MTSLIDGSASPAWAVWITGRPGSGKTTVASALVERLATRGIPATLLDLADLRHVMLSRPHGTPIEEELLHRALVAAAMLLTRAGVPVVIDATGPRRVWRRLAREVICDFAEVQLHCPPDICGQRERAVRWAPALGGRAGGRSPAGADVPDIVFDYEASLDADVVIHTDVRDLSSAVDEILALVLRLHRTNRPRPAGLKEAAMRVRDLMTAEVITVPPTTGVLDARALMDTHRIRHLLVTEEARLVGIVTDRDIRLNQPSPATSLSVWELNYLLRRLTVADVMTKSLLTIGPDRDAAEAARIMVDHKIGALPVLEGGRLAGIITDTDIVRAFAAGAEAFAATPR